MNNFKWQTTAGLLALLVASPAFAADLPHKAPRYAAPIYSAPAFTWSGFYAGLNAGYGFGRASSDYALSIAGVASVPLFSDTTSPTGFIGGAQIGYNFQAGAFVYGVETDWQYSAQKGSSSLLCPGTLCGVAAVAGITLDHTEKLTWFGTLRGRIGYAFDRWMIYGTGGLAYGSIKSDLTATTALGSLTFSNSTTRTGWALGAGVENAISGNWSWKLEYLYMDFGSFTITNALNLPVVLAGTTVNQTVKFTDQIVRVGVNYRF